MSQKTKLQQYKYSLRTVAIATASLCGQKFFAYPVPPDNAISIENLYLHLKLQFDASVTTGDRMITKIGIADSRPAFNGKPNRLLTYDVNIAANASRIVDTTIDLSALLEKSNVKYRDYYDIQDPADTGYTYVYIELAADNTNNGNLLLCKMDCLYTTTGIR